jgi:CspA family cold shock protein
MPSETAPVSEWSEEDLALIKQGVGDKTSRPGGGQAGAGGQGAEGPREQSGSVVTYFEAKGFGFLRPDDGGRDIFFHVSRLAGGDSSELRPGTRVLYELGMDRTGKLAASSVRIAPPAEPAE